MGLRKRRQQDDDNDDSLERAFHAKRSKPEIDPSEIQNDNSSDSKVDDNHKSDTCERKGDNNNIERLREKKRLKKQQQKEKKIAAEKEKEKLEILRKKEATEREKQKEERKKQKEAEQKLATDPNIFVKSSMGVRYADIVVGRGPVLVDRKRVVCRYVLRANDKKGKLLDSGERFSFRIGKGEVIRGWEIGLKGMRQGGKRHIIVPPKAGYGNKDIGGGKGAVLYFEVTLLQC